MRDGLAVAAQRRVGTVKDGGGRRVVDVVAPLPVGEVAVVAALLQLILVDVDKVTVPREEVSLRLS